MHFILQKQLYLLIYFLFEATAELVGLQSLGPNVECLTPGLGASQILHVAGERSIWPSALNFPESKTQSLYLVARIGTYNFS